MWKIDDWMNIVFIQDSIYLADKKVRALEKT